jgi:hypothetical protein
MPKERCSFEVVYTKNEEGIEEIEHVVVRAGLSDASVALTIPQVYNLARLLDIVQHVAERVERPSNGAAGSNGVMALDKPALPRAHAIKS